MSEMVPPEFVIAAEPNALAKKRRRSKPVIFGASVTPTLSSVYIVDEITKVRLRPYTSDSGAQNSGPMANPHTKSDRPSVATSVDTSKRLMRLSMVGEYAELAKVTVNMDRAWVMTMAHFRVLEKFKASSPSFCKKSIT